MLSYGKLYRYALLFNLLMFIYRFCRRHVQYMPPDEAVKCRLPTHLEDRASSFRKDIQQLILEKALKKSQIACMDELFLHLNPSAVKENQHFSVGLQKNYGIPGALALVFLCATADGHLLPPLLVMKVSINFLLLEILFYVLNRNISNI